MSTVPIHDVSPSDNGQPAVTAPAPVVMIRQVAIAAEDPKERALKRQVPAFLASGLFHAALVAAALLYSWWTTRDRTVVPPAEQIVETKVEDALTEKQNFNTEDVGLDPDKPLTYNNERLDDVSVPGKVIAEAKVGIEGAPDGAPQSMPPPPGFGGGQGGGVEADAPGAGQMFGQGGGYMAGRALPGVAFAGRSAATREKMLTDGGGNAASEACVAKGLKWLQRTQKPNGGWSLETTYADDVAATGLGLLPFLAAGQTHKPMRGEKESPFAKTVEHGLTFLKGRQRSNGGFNARALYGEAIATMALCEAYGMTQDISLKKPAQLALDFLVKAQHPIGGFRYRPGEAGDTSVTGWCLQALQSGYLAGLSVPRDTMTNVGNFLDTVKADEGSAYGYTDNNPKPSMTAVGLLCRQYLGWGPKNPSLIAGVERLKKNLPAKGKTEIYYLYYASQVMHFYGGDDWLKVWNPKMRDLLIETQDNSGRPATNGSWPTEPTVTSNAGGRHTVTCLSLMTLEVYYRHLPLYKRDSKALKDLD
jgi:hypothetical protein